ncbi:MAG: Dolichyl-phosphate-mannose-protein mannosyltransferase [Candidatus Curtissbacteria bacterium GW2011_GWA1_41_11]|uniref:Dolichyl-phosphate-mannose-protein mannosyltransferase n=1 Tax=Candidatus Curtissbacteria bacterium GW2011_GWA1_41_11 TaxID=1618409 RepID=A0A0G0UH26_9BACT|nr:MAG: Dolichyl-phosphate-mannose-protein mannosyltransferase [Candidatus Curtissbacteria bacterium GW2011_GWA1_41_11]
MTPTLHLLTRIIKQNLLIILIAIFSCIVLSININKPFIGHHDWNGAFWGVQARNYLSFSSSLLSYGNNVSFGGIFFSHYTPLLPALFSISVAIFGERELSLRLVPLIFSVVMIIFIYKIGQELFDKKTGLLASLLASVIPMFVYFGKLPDHEPIVVSLVTIAFYFYVKSFGKNQENYRLFLVFLFLALFESWPAFFLLPPILAFSLFVKRDSLKKSMMPIIIGIFVVLIHLSVILFTKSAIDLYSFIGQGLFRIGGNVNYYGAVDKSTPYKWIETESRYFVIYYTRLLLLFSLIWIVRLLWEIKKKEKMQRKLSLIILFIYPCLFLLTFRQLVYIHDYKIYHFLPFITLSSAASVVGLAKFFMKSTKKIFKSNSMRTLFSYLIILFIIFSVSIERIKYLLTLENTSFNSPGYQLGLLIKEKTKSDDSILVNSLQFKEFFEVIINYYANRNIEYQNLTMKEFNEHSEQYYNYDYIVLIEDRDIDPSLKKLLDSNYYLEKSGPYMFFNLNKTSAIN